MEIIVGIGEYAISNNKEDILKTFALGSCVALTIYSIRKKVLGLVHIALPCSSINSNNGYQKPGYYVDTAIPCLLNKFINQYNCSKSELIINIFGGAETSWGNDMFEVGKRNVEAVKKILTKNCVTFYSEETGGTYSRNVEADVATGTIKLGKLCLKTLQDARVV
ncbi:MAG: chemotaxis protein CheD [Firmicutes bacterium]|nr:chemotaxis protein CheD [Bacillota bacterium]